MPAETTISTPIPAGVSAETVLGLLHDHDHYIKTTCPQLISYQRTSAEGASPAVYEVTDKRPIGQTTFTLSLTNQPDGIDALIDGRAPTGALRIDSKFRVVADAGRLDEFVSIDSNMLMKKMIKGNVEKSHPDQHRGFLTATA